MKPTRTKNFFKSTDRLYERKIIIKPLLLRLLREKGVLTPRNIDACKYLPSYHVIRKLFKEDGEGIEPIYVFLNKVFPEYQSYYSRRKRYTYEEVIELFNFQGCTLLSNTFVNQLIPMDYICSCGTMSKIDLHNFLNGVRCNSCKKERYGLVSKNKQQRISPCKEQKIISKGAIYIKKGYSEGLHHYNWQGGISKERDLIKRTSQYIDWRNAVYKCDDYICQCCGYNMGHSLHAHHIENYSRFPDLRYDINNGITLCNECHNPNVIGSFHHIYGTKNNNKKQLIQYITERRKQNVS